MDLKQKLMEKTGWSDSELDQKINEKVEKHKNILDRESALFVLARDCGVETEEDTNITVLNLVDENTKNANIYVTVERMFPKKEFESKGKTGFFIGLIVSDVSKKMNLTVWNKELDLKIGDIVLMKNIYAGKFRDEVKLNASEKSDFEVKDHKEISNDVKISELSEPVYGANLKGVLVSKLPLKTFEKEGETQEVIRFRLFDEGFEVSAVAWRDKAKEIDSIDENTLLSISDSNVRKNRGSLEIHLGDSTKIEILEKNVDINTALETAEINSLQYNKKVKVKGQFKNLLKSYTGMYCQTCNKKLENNPDGLFCVTCGKTAEEKYGKVVLNFLFGTDEKQIKTVLFSNSAKKLLEIQDVVEEQVTEKLQNFDYKMNYSLSGYLRKSTFDDEDEFVVEDLSKEE
jgi:hypothetical protein